MRPHLHVAFAALLLVGVGCRDAAELPGKAPGAERVTLRSVTIVRQQQVAPGSGCSVSAAAPTIEPQKDLPNDIREELNATLRAVSADALHDAGGDPEAAASAWMSACAAQVADMLAHLQDAPAGLWTNELAYDIRRNDGRVLSLVLRNSRYEGGAHPSSVTVPLTFSLSTGKRLSLSDLSVSGREGALMAALLGRTLSAQRDALFPEQAKEFEALVEAPTSERGRALMERYADFYLTSDRLVLAFDPYEIAPYAAGPIETSVSFAELDGLLRLP